MPDGQLSYSEALEAVARSRNKVLAIVPVQQPDLMADKITQTMLATSVALMLEIGWGSLPITRFDEPITYQHLAGEIVEWLETCGVPARSYLPLASDQYARLFGTKGRLPVKEQNVGQFFGRWIHMLLIETQITLARQYYHGLDLYKQGITFSMLSEVLPTDEIQGMRLSRLGNTEIDQLHGRIFLEYCAVMIKAQWDKSVFLLDLVFGLKSNWDSVTKGLDAIERSSEARALNRWSEFSLRKYLEIARKQLAVDGWLKSFRDPLLHKVGRHSAGVLPQKNSLDTTSEMWDRVREEHNALREALMALISVLITKNVNGSSDVQEQV